MVEHDVIHELMSIEENPNRDNMIVGLIQYELGIYSTEKFAIQTQMNNKEMHSFKERETYNSNNHCFHPRK